MATVTFGFSTFANDSSLGSVAWSNPGNASASDDTWASVSLGGAQISQYLKCTNPTPASPVPAGATINSITLKYECNYESVFARDYSVKVVRGGVISGTDKADTVNNWNQATDTEQTRGGDLWGLTGWTPADFDANFGFVISCTRPSGVSPSPSGRIDRVWAIVDYTPAASTPTITSFTPTSGAPGTSVTITGTNFTGATAVKFNGVDAASFTVNSATQITATVPNNATTGTLSVTTPAGTGTSGTNFTVTRYAVRLNFTAAPAGHTVTLYKTRQGANGGPILRFSSTVTGTSYLDVDVDPGYRYEYTIRHFRSSDALESRESNSAAVTIPGTPPSGPPATPTGLTAALE